MKNLDLQFNLLRQRAQREPFNAALFRDLLLYTEITGNYDDSVVFYHDILDHYPYAAPAWYNLGIAFQQLDNSEAALEALEYAYITDCRFEAAYQAYIEYAMRLGLFRQALLCCQEMLVYIDSSAEVLLDMSECHRALGDIAQAKQLSQEALQLEPYSAPAYRQLGLCYAAEQQHHMAERSFRQALRLDDTEEATHLALARTQHVLGRHEEAEVHYWRAIELAPEVPESWSALANLQLESGDRCQALETIAQAMEFLSEADLLYARAASLLLSGHRRKGMDALRIALQAAAAHHQTLFSWAAVLRNDEQVCATIEAATKR
jgi:tetratricopeptide (TPR) repeat protein